MNFGWKFERGTFDPTVGTTPVQVLFTMGDESGRSDLVAVITEEAAQQMRDALDEVCGTGLQVALTLPPTNGQN